jgi:hypothetical protein
MDVMSAIAKTELHERALPGTRLYSYGGCEDLAERSASPLWTRLRCARGHLREHPGTVELVDVDAPCWCGGPRVAATVFRVSEPAGGTSSSVDSQACLARTSFHSPPAE